ncbi:hypothetical protein EGH24_05235 [Halonotius terrestris]|uniref:HEAT repeat n=1 Tax=Halonotius terrestris TaxID=2487750 RepID=A0A8J8TBY0_9EURY|nr:HEAT repeat domain-containing protein [Halonotius terrestris]TQQ82845.1 hypothetical protein EGH24_05235 [Halonotius terrestris]
MDETPQGSQTDFLYTLATNGQFARIANYLASNEPVAVRRGAAGILTEFAGEFEDRATDEFKAQLINAVLEETDETVRARAVETLLYLDDSIIDNLVTRIAADDEPTPTDSPHPLVLVEWLGSQHAELRLLAVAGLGDVGSDHMIPKLTAACSDQDRRVRERALAELGRIGDHRAIDAIADRLDSDIGAIRREAASALAAIGTKDAINRLKPAAKTDDERLRRLIMDELGAIGTLETLDMLIDGLEDDDPEVRAAAASSIVESVSSASFEESHVIRENAVDSLERLAEDEDIIPEFVSVFTESHRTTIRRNTAWLLGRIGDSRDSVVDALLDALSDDDTATALIAGSSLALLGDRDIEDQIEAYLDDQPEESPARTRAEFVKSQIADSEADVILKRTVEYIFVAEPEDYTRQKAESDEETESEGEPTDEELEPAMETDAEEESETETDAEDESDDEIGSGIGYGDRFHD